MRPKQAKTIRSSPKLRWLEGPRTNWTAPVTNSVASVAFTLTLRERGFMHSNATPSPRIRQPEARHAA